MADDIAKTPAGRRTTRLIFTSLRTAEDNGYGEMADQIEELAKAQPGYLGFENARSGLGIRGRSWRTLEDIAAWKQQGRTTPSAAPRPRRLVCGLSRCASPRSSGNTASSGSSGLSSPGRSPAPRSSDWTPR